MLKKYIEKVISGMDLTSSEMEEVMSLFMTEKSLSSVQTGAFLGALQAKGISSSELAGGVKAMKNNSLYFDIAVPDAMDIVGTGGDGGRSFNISTASAIVAAGAGLKIAKHGGRASSGKCGSADVLEALGIDLTLSPEIMVKSLVQNGLGFFYAPVIHPLMSKMATIRKQLGIRSFFNLLGPLGNPIPITKILLGTPNQDQLDLFADTLIGLNYKRAAVVCSKDHLDEISCFAPTEMIEIYCGQKTHSLIDPNDYFTSKELEGSLEGKDPEYNAQLIRGILKSEIKGAPLSVVLLNAGTALYIAGLASSISEGIQLARDSVESGAAVKKLDLLINLNESEMSCYEDISRNNNQRYINTTIGPADHLLRKNCHD